MTSFSVLLVFCGILAIASAGTISWTGGAGNSLWSFAGNWNGNKIPSADDDVIINYLGGASISISQPAYAKSVTIAGGNYAQTLTLLSSLEVGAGGILVGNKGTLQLQSNNDLPLSSEGRVTAQAGGAVVFNSGDVTGPGAYTIEAGASILFGGSALKLLEAVDLNIKGTATIQPTTIQLSKGATITNNGDLTAVGMITIFSSDKSKASFTSFGNFSYQGAGSASPLTFQLTTYLSGEFSVLSGSVVVNDYFYSVGVVTVPAGAALIVRSGDALKTFTNIIGAGSLTVEGTAEIKNNLQVSSATVADSGSLTLAGNASATATAKSLVVSGKLILASGLTFIVVDVTLSAGTVTGAGRLFSSGNFEIAVSSTGNVNNFISALVNISGSGYLTGSAFVLFADAGNLYITQDASFKISATAHFGKQTGSPVVTNNGKFTVVLPVGNTFDSNVDYVGSGVFSVTSGAVTFEGNTFKSSAVSLGTSALLTFKTSVINAGAFVGLGSLNVTAAPTPVSEFGDIILSYFGVPSGAIKVNSVSVSTLAFWGGSLSVAAGTSNKATIFDFYGGTLQGTNAKLASTSINIFGPTPQVIDGVAVTADKLTVRTPTNGGTLMTENGATITVGSSSL